MLLIFINENRLSVKQDKVLPGGCKNMLRVFKGC